MENDLKLIKNLLLFIFAVLGVYLLSLLSAMLIPLALALFMAMLLQPALAWFEKKRVPFLISILAISIPSLSGLTLSGLLISKTAKDLYAEKDILIRQIKDKSMPIVDWVGSYTTLDLDIDDFSIDKILNGVLNISSQLVDALGDFTGLFFMTLLYFIVLLGSILRYEQYLHYLEEGSNQRQLLESFEQVKSSVVTYTKVKFLISFATGVGYFFICWLFGIEFALFWGFLAFILNFIPTFGSIVATLPPIFLGLVFFDDYSTLGFLALCLFAVQMVMGNVLEPKLMGEKLSLNTITVLVGLVFWGYVWGITGMILSMPLLVLTKVILAQIPDAQLLVRLMGSAPNVDTKPKN